MTGDALYELLQTLDAEGWQLTAEDIAYLKTCADYHEGLEEWYANNGDTRNGALTAGARNGWTI